MTRFLGSAIPLLFLAHFFFPPYLQVSRIGETDFIGWRWLLGTPIPDFRRGYVDVEIFEGLFVAQCLLMIVLLVVGETWVHARHRIEKPNQDNRFMVWR